MGGRDLVPDDPRRIGRFRVIARLGFGGMGVVYLGEHGRGQRVAIKLLRSELADSEELRIRFAREIAAASRVRAECTARFVADGSDDERPWFATEYVEGPTLDAFVRSGRRLQGDELRALAVGVAAALAAIGRAGLVHRDLKPTNLLLSPTGPRVIDFGIALADASTALTRTGQRLGTQKWMAPEQVLGEPVCSATDVFGWGALVAFAGTGAPPFGTGESSVVLERVLHGAPALAGLDPSLCSLVERALLKSAADRPTIDDLLDELLGSAPEVGLTSTDERVHELIAREWPQNLPVDDPRPRKASSRRRRGIMVAAAVLAVAGLGAALALRAASTPAHARGRGAVVSARPRRPTAATTTVPPTTTTTLSATAARVAAESLVTGTGYTPQAEGPFERDTPFTVILALGGGNEHPYRAFLFAHRAFVGWDAPESSKGMELLAADGTTVTLRYDLYRKDDANCCPSGGKATVRFQWDGTKIVNLDPIPSADVRNNAVL